MVKTVFVEFQFQIGSHTDDLVFGIDLAEAEIQAEKPDERYKDLIEYGRDFIESIEEGDKDDEPLSWARVGMLNLNREYDVTEERIKEFFDNFDYDFESTDYGSNLLDKEKRKKYVKVLTKILEEDIDENFFNENEEILEEIQKSAMELSDNMLGCVMEAQQKEARKYFEW